MKNKSLTIGRDLNRILVLTFAIVGITVGAGLGAYYMVKRTLSRDILWNELSHGIEKEVEMLIPAFLIPEQRSGATILLDRIKLSKKLISAQMINDRTELPSDFRHCVLDISTVTECFSSDQKAMALLAPIREGNIFFGHLMEIKNLKGSSTYTEIAPTVETVALVMVMVFVTLFFLLSRLTHKKIPHELTELLTWLEKTMEEASGDKKKEILDNPPALLYHELNALATRLAILLQDNLQAQKLKVSSKLGAQMAHDIRTPLATLKVVHQQLQGHQGILPTEQLQLLTSAMERIEHMSLELLNSNKKVQLQESDRKEILLSPLIKEVIEEARLQIDHDNTHTLQSRIEINFDNSFEEAAVNGNEMAMKRVLSNLVRNGIQALEFKFKKEGAVGNAIPVIGPKLFIKIFAAPYLEQQRLCLQIIDNGRGMSRARVAQLNTGSVTTDRSDGNGLGLSHAQQVIQKMDGALVLSSVEGEGTTVEIILPCQAHVQHEGSEAKRIPSKNRLPKKLVLIDDDELVRMTWSFSGRKRGIEVLTFKSIADFLKSSSDFDRGLPIYVDSNLGEGIKGELESEKIYAQGFQYIKLATGEVNLNLATIPWIMGIQDKTFPL